MSDESTFTSATAHGFLSQLALADSGAIQAASLGTIMLNVTLRCDLACAHCHQSCSPSRTEEMSRETMLSALELDSSSSARRYSISPAASRNSGLICASSWLSPQRGYSDARSHEPRRTLPI